MPEGTKDDEKNGDAVSGVMGLVKDMGVQRKKGHVEAHVFLPKNAETPIYF